MENITLGQVGAALAFLVSFLTGCGWIVKRLKDFIKDTLKEEVGTLRKDINGLGTRLDKVDMEATKNYLVSYLSKAEQGLPIDEIERERFCEEYDHYKKDLKGNSYITHKVEKLKSEGKI